MFQKRWIGLWGFILLVILTGMIAEFAKREWVGILVPLEFALFLGALCVLGWRTGQVWTADRGGTGPYQISRRKDPFWFWATVGQYGVFAIIFALLFIGKTLAHVR